MRDSIKKDISDQPELWMCTTCYNCQERCPRGIKVTDAVFTLRSEAVKKERYFRPTGRYAIFLSRPGNLFRLMTNTFEKATGLVLDRLGVKWSELAEAACCPEPGIYRSFDKITWLTLASRNLVLAEEKDTDILTICNGCFSS